MACIYLNGQKDFFCDILWGKTFFAIHEDRTLNGHVFIFLYYIFLAKAELIVWKN